MHHTQHGWCCQEVLSTANQFGLPLCTSTGGQGASNTNNANHVAACQVHVRQHKAKHEHSTQILCNPANSGLHFLSSTAAHPRKGGGQCPSPEVCLVCLLMLHLPPCSRRSAEEQQGCTHRWWMHGALAGLMHLGAQVVHACRATDLISGVLLDVLHVQTRPTHIPIPSTGRLHSTTQSAVSCRGCSGFKQALCTLPVPAPPPAHA